MKHPLLFKLKAEDVPRRVENLRTILGEEFARECLRKEPTILLSRKATPKELWCNSIEMSSESELLTRIRCKPNMLG